MAHESWVGQSLDSFTPGGATNYVSFASCYDLGDEASSQIISAAGTYNKASIFVQSSSSTATIRFRKNTANGNQVISIGSSLTGWFQDTTNSDTVSSGDNVCLQIVTSAGVTLAGVISCQFTPSGSTAVSYYGQGNVRGPNGGAGTYFNWLAGACQTNDLTEAKTQTVWRAAGTFSGLSMLPNSGGQQPGVKTRINAADGTQVLTAGGAGTRQTDTTHSDAVVSGDKISITTTANDRWSSMYMRFTSSDDKYEILCGRQGGVNNGSHYIIPFGQTASPGTVEARAQAKAPTGITLTKLRMNVDSNVALNNSTVFSSRINGATGNLTVTVPFGTTGFFEDTTHTDTLSAGDLFCTLAAGGQTSGSVTGNIAYLATVTPSAATITTNTTSTFSGISQNFQAYLKHSSTTVSTFAGISQVFLATRSTPGAITSTFQGISQTFLAKRATTSVTVSSFQGISQTFLAYHVRGPGLGRRQFWTS